MKNFLIFFVFFGKFYIPFLFLAKSSFLAYNSKIWFN